LLQLQLIKYDYYSEFVLKYVNVRIFYQISHKDFTINDVTILLLRYKACKSGVCCAFFSACWVTARELERPAQRKHRIAVTLVSWEWIWQDMRVSLASCVCSTRAEHAISRSLPPRLA